MTRMARSSELITSLVSCQWSVLAWVDDQGDLCHYMLHLPVTLLANGEWRLIAQR